MEKYGKNDLLSVKKFKRFVQDSMDPKENDTFNFEVKFETILKKYQIDRVEKMTKDKLLAFISKTMIEKEKLKKQAKQHWA